MLTWIRNAKEAGKNFWNLSWTVTVHLESRTSGQGAVRLTMAALIHQWLSLFPEVSYLHRLPQSLQVPPFPPLMYLTWIYGGLPKGTATCWPLQRNQAGEPPSYGGLKEEDLSRAAEGLRKGPLRGGWAPSRSVNKESALGVGGLAEERGEK